VKILGFQITRSNPENPNGSLSGIFDWLQGSQSSSGIVVNKDNALTFSAYFGAVKILQETLAQLPVNVYKRTEQGKEIDNEHPAQRLIHSEASRKMTSYTFREVMQGYAVCRGNGIALIKRDSFAKPLSLVPIPLEKKTVEIRESEDDIFYEIDGYGIIPSEDIIHIQGFATDGIVGRGLLDVAKEAIGLGLGQQRFAANLFKNGANPSGVLTHPGKLDKDGAERLKVSWQKNYGAGKSHGTAVLEEGMKYEPVSMTPEDTQLIESRRLSVLDISRYTRIPPHMLSDLERATFSNIEEQNLNFIAQVALSWAKKWEQELNRKLLREEEKKNNTHFIEFNFNALLKANVKDRGMYYVQMLQNGVYNPNEIRSFENENKREGGDKYMTPLNMQNGNKESNSTEPGKKD
jgi:HK97 family phage portal protein